MSFLNLREVSTKNFLFLDDLFQLTCRLVDELLPTNATFFLKHKLENPLRCFLLFSRSFTDGRQLVAHCIMDTNAIKHRALLPSFPTIFSNFQIEFDDLFTYQLAESTLFLKKKFRLFISLGIFFLSYSSYCTVLSLLELEQSKYLRILSARGLLRRN